MNELSNVFGQPQGAQAFDQLFHHRLGGRVPVSHAGVEPGDVGVLELFGDGGQGFVGHQALQGQVLLAHGARQQFLAAVDRLLAALLAEPLLDLVARAG